MSRVSLVFLFLIFIVNSFAQQASISATKMNVAYIGIKNPITIIMENTDCDDILVKVDKGTIEKVSDCNYIFEPAWSVGETVFTISNTQGDIVEIMYRIRRVPDPLALLGGLLANHYHYSRSTLAGQSSIIPILKDFEFDYQFSVVSYKFRYCKDGVLHEIFNKGAAYSPAIQEVISNSKEGEVLHFFDIIVQGENSNDRRKVRNITYQVSYCGEYDKTSFARKSGFQCSCDCAIFHEKDETMKTEEYVKICGEDTVLHTIQDYSSAIITGSIKAITSDSATISEGEYIEKFIAIDTFYQINPITLIDEIQCKDYLQKVKHGTWHYYNEQSKLIRTEKYDMGTMIKEEEF